MKKLRLGIVGIMLFAVTCSVGSTPTIEEIKTRINTELSNMEKTGFTLEDRKIGEKKEHLVLVFSDPKKIVEFFKKQKKSITIENAQVFVGMKLGVDLTYLPNPSSQLSMDIYPLSLPSSIIDNAKDNAENKALMAQISDGLKKKVMMVHVDFNEMFSEFKGYIKDIDEVSSTGSATTAISLKGATFSGTATDDRITSLIQHVKNFAVFAKEDKLMILSASNWKSEYKLKEKSLYDSTDKYVIEKVRIKTETASLDLKDIEGESETAVLNEIASTKTKFKIADSVFMQNGQKIRLTDAVFAVNVNGVNVNILKNISMENEEEVNKLLQELISSGMTIEIPAFGVREIEHNAQKTDGFSLTSFLEFKKSANIAKIKANPLAIKEAINAKVKLSLSDALFNLIVQNPQGKMLPMFVQAQSVDGKKVYEAEVKDGNLTVNGKPMM